MFTVIPLVNTKPKYIQPKRKVFKLKLLRFTRIMIQMIQYRQQYGGFQLSWNALLPETVIVCRICSLQFFTHRSHTIRHGQSHFSGLFYSLRFKGFFFSKFCVFLPSWYDIHAKICTLVFKQTQALLRHFLDETFFFCCSFFLHG